MYHSFVDMTRPPAHQILHENSPWPRVRTRLTLSFSRRMGGFSLGRSSKRMSSKTWFLRSWRLKKGHTTQFEGYSRSKLHLNSV